MITVKFSEIKVGDKFFDPFCGDEFVKVSDTEATFTNAGDAFAGELAPFRPGERVQIQETLQ